MDLIYAVCSWGLGHATRSLPVLRKLIAEDNNVTVISHDRSLTLLQHELGSQATYVDIPDYPILISENTRQFLAKTVVYWPKFIAQMEAGLQRLTKYLIQHPCDIIVSDGRYDMYSKRIPSFFISHQMRIMNPLRLQWFESGSEIFNKFFFKRFQEVIVPDYRKDDLSGELSHGLKRIDENKLYYVGVLSDFSKKSMKKDIDYLLSISGPEPQRSTLEQTLFGQLQNLRGTIVVTLGKTESTVKNVEDNITVYSFVSKEKREELLNRAKLVVSRSGYSTIMDLAVMGTKALLIPTPGQIEQEYLGQYHRQKKTFYAMSQKNIDLSRDIPNAQKTRGITRKCSVEKTVETIIDILINKKKN